VKITDLDKFAIEELFRPYCSTFDPQIYELEYKQNNRISAARLQLKYEQKIKDDLSILIKWFNENAEFKKYVFKRLRAIDKKNRFVFPSYIQHKLKDYVIKELEVFDEKTD